MKRFMMWMAMGLAMVAVTGCARGRTSWFNRGAPCSTCGESAPVYNGAVIPSNVVPPPPLPENIPPAS